jgi:hypothetical protein
MEDHDRRLRRPQFGVLLLPLLFMLGCGAKEKVQPAANAAADSTAFAQVTTIEDDGARFEALAKFIKERPKSDQAGEAFVDLIDLAKKTNPGAVQVLLRQFLATDFPSPNPYNAVGWDLAESGQHLDLAVPILEKAVAKARAEADTMGLASCLDSEAWARHKKGDHPLAVQRMEEAYGIYGPGNDEIDLHMATIYDAAGMKDKARPLYVNLLGHMEDPTIREKLAAIVTGAGESMDKVSAEINAARMAGAEMAPAFSLPSQADGKPISLADFKGKVVLLNFWHYT